jgi:Ca-activated chloride channel family protein
MSAARPARSGLIPLLAAALILLGAVRVAAAQGIGALAGTVTEAATGEALPGANVVLPGVRMGVATDVAGRFHLAGIPSGTHTVRVSFAGFATRTLTGVVVVADSTRRLNVALDGAQLGEVVVTYERPLIQRDAISAARVLTAEESPRRARRSRERPPAHARTLPVRSVAPGQDLTDPAPRRAAPWDRPGTDREQYVAVSESPFHRPESTPLSTFSIDVDRASYANVRRFLDAGSLPPPDAVRIEEFLNAFDYRLDGPAPTDTHPFLVHTEVAEAPWAPGHRLVRIALQARRVATADLPPANLVFLVDVSGSMTSPDKLPLVQQALSLLVRHLRPQDRVALVVYAGASGLVLPPTSGADRQVILDAIGRLQSGGSTAGSAGLTLAYETARAHFRRDAVNRVILATDGDFNVGPSSDAEMRRLVERERASGVFLTVLGVGTGNLQDARMETMAQAGNGAYAYLDSIREAERVLVREMGGTLVALAKDVKVQVEFNPAEVAAYRLIGYDNRRLPDEAFNDDTHDAGELGAGHTVTALYEVIPAGRPVPDASAVDPLRYQRAPALTREAASGDLLTVRFRYKPSTGPGAFADESVLLAETVRDAGARLDQASDAMRWSTAVAEAALMLRESEHRAGASLDAALARAAASQGQDADRAEFVRLVERARQMVQIAARSDSAHEAE